MPSSTWDAYLEFTCADEATQSELWDESIRAIQKYPLQNLRVGGKKGRLQDMSKEQDHMSMEPNWHYDVADWDKHSQEDYHGTQATLALAFEQRTANLIELYKHGGGTDPKLGAMIQARMGL